MHWIANAPGQILKGYGPLGIAVWSWPVRNDTVAAGYYHWGQCPPGDYRLGTPMPLDPPETPFGRWYVPLLDVNKLWVRYERDGIGIHGGGSGLPTPFAPRQGWVITEGCFRLQNEDLASFVHYMAPGELFTCFQGVAT